MGKIQTYQFRLQSVYSSFFSKDFNRYLVCAALLFIGFIYFSANSISFSQITRAGQTVSLPDTGKASRNQDYVYSIAVHAFIGQTAQVNVVANKRINYLKLNDKIVRPIINYPKTRTTYQDVDYGDVFELKLKSGKNSLVVSTFDDDGHYKFNISQKLSLFDFLFLAITIVLPLVFISFNVFVYLLGYKDNVIAGVTPIPLGVHLVWIAIVIRIIYFFDMGYIQFQHDYHGHIEFIKFFAENFYVPLPHKGWEYPQQPFYYVINGLIFYVTQLFDMAEKPALKVIGFITTVLSCISIIYAYALLKLLTSERIVHNLALGFLCFTPSIIYLSTRINNDPWAASLSIIALFYIVAAYKADFTRYLWPALITTSLLFLTKISAVGIELLFLVLLLAVYFKHPERTRASLYNYAWVGILLLSYTFYRTYYPAAGSFVFVNSGIWPGQDLRPLDANYFLTFHFADLFEQAQSHIREKDTDAIKFSFLTYQYGTMLFGQFDYEYWKNRNYLLTITMQLIIVFALIVPIGWFLYSFRKKTFLEKGFLVVAAITFILILKFIFQYPSISNTDFRYYSGIFFMQALFFAYGIYWLVERFPRIKNVVMGWCYGLFILQTFYMINIILV